MGRLTEAVGPGGGNHHGQSPEARVTNAFMADLAQQDITLQEIHPYRGYRASDLVRDRSQDLAIYCKAWLVRNGDRYAKTAFTLDWDAGTTRCPDQVSIPFRRISARRVPSETAAPPVLRVGEATSIQTNDSFRSCATDSSLRRAARSCGNGCRLRVPARGFRLGKCGTISYCDPAVQPPSTASTEPVTNELASEARNTAGPTISSGAPTRPRACSDSVLAHHSRSRAIC